MSILYPEEGDSVWIRLNDGEEFPAKWISETPAAIKVHTRVLKMIPWSNIKEIVVNDRKAESDKILLKMKQEIWDFEEAIKRGEGERDCVG